MRGVTIISSYSLLWEIFLLTHLMRGVTSPWKTNFEEMAISTHTPHARCDVVTLGGSIKIQKFLLTHLMRGVTLQLGKDCVASGFLLTHLMRGVTFPMPERQRRYHISTHTPHARCDECSRIKLN